ncbi:MAG: hypothetical protein OXF39_09995 [Nitrospira sp.]|nr:hypothetical protein [Nitrospira sp.]
MGEPITVTVSYTDGGGTAESLTSTATAEVANINDAPTGRPTITGTATQGQTLTANTGGISDPDGLGTFSYQWKRSGTNISGATSSTYTLVQADVGETITVTVSYTDVWGTAESLTSAATATVASMNTPVPATPVVSIAAGTSPVTEGTSATFTLTASPAPTASISVSVNVTARGSFGVTTGARNVSIGTGGTATLTVTTTDDSTDEANGSVTATVSSGTGYTAHGTNNSATVAVNDDDTAGVTDQGVRQPPSPPPPTRPTVAFAATASRAGEDAGTRTITITLRPAPSSSLTLRYTLAGTATPGTDYTIRGVPRRTGTLTVPANQSSVTIPVALTDDSTDEPDETVILTLTTGTGYEVGSSNVHTLTISGDGDGGDPTPVVAFAAGISSAPEGAGTQQVAVTLAPPPTAPLTLTYTVGGTATPGRDHDLPLANSGPLAVPAGSPTATITVTLLDDHVDEDAETVRLTLTDGDGYTVGETRVHTLTITDNDTAGLRVAPATVHLTEAGATATVTLHLTSQPTAPVLVTLASAQPHVATVTPASLRVPPEAWQTPQRMTVTAGTDGATTLRVTVQSTDPAYTTATLTRQAALPRLRVRVGADPTALLTPWLARFGRTVTGQAVIGLTARLAAARTPGLTGTVAGLALDRLGDNPAAAPARLAPPSGEPTDPRLNPGGRLLNFRDLLAGSAFALTSTPSATGGSYALWGQGAWTRFAGQEHALDVDGDVLSGTLGVDWAQGPWVLGVAMSHTQGEGDSAGTKHRGELESSLTLVTPYVGVDVTEQVTLWGTVGYGRGTVALTLPTEPEMETDTSLLLAAGGLRGRLLEPASTGGLALAVRSEARFLRTTAEEAAAHGLEESEADVILVQLGVEGAWHKPLAHGGSLVPRLDLSLRQDAGDAEQGFGVEVRGGVRWEAPAHGLTLDLAGQTLLAHSDQDFETWGGTATVLWDPDPVSAAGPTLTLRQTYGGAGAGGASPFWTEDPVALLPTPGPADLRVTAEFGWGLPLRSGLGVPHVAYGWAPASRDLALGWRLLPTRTTAVRLDLTATHREAARTAPVQGVSLSLTRNW